MRRERLHEVAAVGLLEVDAHALLAERVAQERGAGATTVEIGHERRRAAAGFAVARVLDLDHLGAEPAEQHRGVGQRLHLLDREDAHAVERLAVVLRPGVADVTNLHGSTFMPASCILAGAPQDSPATAEPVAGRCAALPLDAGHATPTRW